MKAQDGQACFIRAMDAQRAFGKSLFGGGFLLSKKAAATRWALSPREIEMQTKLSLKEA